MGLWKWRGSLAPEMEKHLTKLSERPQNLPCVALAVTWSCVSPGGWGACSLRSRTTLHPWSPGEGTACVS